MLQLTIPKTELFDPSKQEFCTTKETTIILEHSLLSVSKWESNWCKPFLSSRDKTKEEIIDYVRCMTITNYVDPDVYLVLNSKLLDEISDYIAKPMTATTFSTNESRKGINREIITSEIIYYWMIVFNIPFECQKWHLNRLLTLINVCNIKNQPAKKMTRQELLSRNRLLNESRKRQLNTRG